MRARIRAADATGAAPAAALDVDEALVAQLRELLLPDDAAASREQLAARLRAVAAALEAPPRAPEAACGEAAAAADEGDALEEGDAAQRKRRLPKPFDMSRYAQRLVALELCYAGWAYHGFASQGYAADAAETVETRLFAALRATRLIAPDATWADVLYSRCGRTDRGVSALRQMVAVRLRCAGPPSSAGGAPSTELDFVQLLNRQLPDDIRVLSWRPAPEGFSARFTARWRQYKYFFWDDGRLDVGAMRDAAARLVGTHDFRNFCKMDVENVSNFVRRIHWFTVQDEETPRDASPAAAAAPPPPLAAGGGTAPAPPQQPHLGRLMSLNVRGNAFLYHQVRCMAAVLFLVGRGLEAPPVVDALLDVAANPCKPMYEMAAEEALLFYACGYEEGALGPPERAPGPPGAKSRALLTGHLREQARRAAVRAAVLRAALAAVAEDEPEPAGAAPALPAAAKHVPLAARRREPSYEEQRERLRAKGKAAAGDAMAE